MRGLVGLLLLGALLALPQGAACSWAPVDPLQDPTWHAGTLHGATDVFWRGPVDFAAGRATPAYPREALVAPDGASFAFPREGPDVQTGPTRRADSCGFHLPRHLVAYDAATDVFRMVDEGPLWGVGASEEGVHAFGEETVRVYAWGTWERVREEPTRGRVEALSWRGVLDVAERPAIDLGSPYRVAWSPEGAHVATLGEDATLRVRRASDGEVVATALASPYADLDWGAGGLLVAGGDGARITVYPRAPSLDAPVERAWEGAERAHAAWAPDGRLAVTMPLGERQAHVLILDRALEVEQDVIVAIAPFDEAAWEARVASQVPVPTYSTLTKIRETPAPGWTLVVVLAAIALSRPLRRPRARGTSRGPRP